jgi:hypothetical protein
MTQITKVFLLLFLQKKKCFVLPSDPNQRRDVLPGYPDIGQFPVGKSGEFLRRGPLGPPGLEQADDPRENARMGFGAWEGRLPGEEEVAKFAKRQRAGKLVMVGFSHDTHL